MGRVIDYGSGHPRVAVPYFTEELRECVESLPEKVQRELALGPLPHDSCRLCKTFSGEWGWGDGQAGVGDWPDAAISLHAYHNAAEIGEPLESGRAAGSLGSPCRLAVMAVMQARSFLIYEMAATAIYGERV